MNTTLVEIGKEMGLDKDQVKRFADMFWKAHFQRTVNLCAVCDKELTDDDFRNYPKTPFDFFRTCKEHVAFRQIFQIDIVRKELGFPLYPDCFLFIEFNPDK